MKEIAWLITILCLIILFDIQIGFELFEDGSFIISKLTGCIPFTLCNQSPATHDKRYYSLMNWYARLIIDRGIPRKG